MPKEPITAWHRPHEHRGGEKENWEENKDGKTTTMNHVCLWDLFLLWETVFPCEVHECVSNAGTLPRWEAFLVSTRTCSIALVAVDGDIRLTSSPLKARQVGHMKGLKFSLANGTHGSYYSLEKLTTLQWKYQEASTTTTVRHTLFSNVS
jgi:hypothetical protein